MNPLRVHSALRVSTASYTWRLEENLYFFNIEFPARSAIYSHEEVVENVELLRTKRT